MSAASILHTRRLCAQPYVASVPVRVSASVVTTAVGPLAGTIVRLPRLMATPERGPLTSSSASPGRPSTLVARQLTATASWLCTGGYQRVPWSRHDASSGGVNRAAAWCEDVAAATTRGYGEALMMPPDHPSHVGPPGRRYGHIQGCGAQGTIRPAKGCRFRGFNILVSRG